MRLSTSKDGGMPAAEAPATLLEPLNFFLFSSAPAEASEFDISDPAVVQAYATSERQHFWFQARNRQLRDFFRRDGVVPPARVLDVGCGMGGVMSGLLKEGYEVTGVELHADLGRIAARANPGAKVYALDMHAPPEPFLSQAPFDVVGVFDVIEHLDDPVSFLRACARLVRPGGRLVGTVPALMALWSDYDALGSHRLRYDRRSLGLVFEQLGLRPEKVEYFFQTLVPGMVARRVLIGRGAAKTAQATRDMCERSLRPPSQPLNRAFGAICELERFCRRHLPLGVLPGSSLWFSTVVPGGFASRSSE
jgi:SAM-dependent methyltransferase